MVKFISFDEVIEYSGIKKLDLQRGIISLSLGYFGGGGWSTCLPISPPEYRKKYPTSSPDRVKLSVFEGADEITFNITDDYGSTYTLTITGEEMKNPIVQNEVKKIKALQK